MTSNTWLKSGEPIIVCRPFAPGTKENRQTLRAGSKGRIVGFRNARPNCQNWIEVLTEDGAAVVSQYDIKPVNPVPADAPLFLVEEVA